MAAVELPRLTIEACRCLATIRSRGVVIRQVGIPAPSSARNRTKHYSSLALGVIRGTMCILGNSRSNTAPRDSWCLRARRLVISLSMSQILLMQRHDVGGRPQCYPKGLDQAQHQHDAMHRRYWTSISRPSWQRGGWPLVREWPWSRELQLDDSRLPKLWDTTDAGSKHPRELFRSRVGQSQPYGHVSRVLRERPPHWLEMEYSRRGPSGFVRPPPVAQPGFASACSRWCPRVEKTEEAVMLRMRLHDVKDSPMSFHVPMSCRTHCVSEAC